MLSATPVEGCGDWGEEASTLQPLQEVWALMGLLYQAACVVGPVTVVRNAHLLETTSTAFPPRGGRPVFSTHLCRGCLLRSIPLVVPPPVCHP